MIIKSLENQGFTIAWPPRLLFLVRQSRVSRLHGGLSWTRVGELWGV